jgi:hypothetical protein
MELHEKATAALSWFETGERKSEDTGRMIRVIPHGAEGPGEWLTELCRKAHGDMFPDDFRYEMIEDALTYFADESNDADDYGEQCDNLVPVYNAERLRWLASHLERAGYCDEACEENGIDGSMGIMDRIALGFYAEVSEVFGLVRQALADADEDAITTRPEKGLTQEL